MKTRITLLSLATLIGCGTSEPSEGVITGNGLVSVEMGLTSSDSATDLVGEDAQGTNFTVTVGMASIREIDLQLPEGLTCADLSRDAYAPPVVCEPGDGSPTDEDTLVINGPFIVDLITRAVTPSIDDVRVPALTYRRARVRFAPGDPSDGLINSGDALDDVTIVANGGFTYNATPSTFDLALRFNESAEFESAGGVTVEENLAANILLWLDVGVWFDTLPLTQCLDDGDLTLVGTNLTIEDDSGGCSDVENALKGAIEASGELTGE